MLHVAGRVVGNRNQDDNVAQVQGKHGHLAAEASLLELAIPAEMIEYT